MTGSSFHTGYYSKEEGASVDIAFWWNFWNTKTRDFWFDPLNYRPMTLPIPHHVISPEPFRKSTVENLGRGGNDLR